MKYSWQALSLSNKPFDHLKILVFDFTYLLSFKTTKYVHKFFKNYKKKNIQPTSPVFLDSCSTTKQVFFFFA